MRYAALLHLVHWGIPDVESYDLGCGAEIHSFPGSNIEKLYEQLCSERGLDDGEPFLYGAYFTIDPKIISMPVGRDDADTGVSRLCNLLTIVTGVSIGMSRVISLSDSNQFLGYCEMGHDYTHATEFISHESPRLTMSRIGELSALWTIDCDLRRDYAANRRLINALTYFNFSWLGYYLDQVCINLAIVLETLFSPASNTELAHQIAFNAAHFLASTPEKRTDVYDTLKSFYTIRSQIVHGDWPNQDALCKLTPEVFRLSAEAIRRVLLDDHLRRVFNDSKLRKDVFREWLFK